MIASRGEPAAKPDPSSVLTKAVARAAERLDISRFACQDPRREPTHGNSPL